MRRGSISSPSSSSPSSSFFEEEGEVVVVVVVVEIVGAKSVDARGREADGEELGCTMAVVKLKSGVMLYDRSSSESASGCLLP